MVFLNSDAREHKNMWECRIREEWVVGLPWKLLGKVMEVAFNGFAFEGSIHIGGEGVRIGLFWYQARKVIKEAVNESYINEIVIGNMIKKSPQIKDMYTWLVVMQQNWVRGVQVIQTLLS